MKSSRRWIVAGVAMAMLAANGLLNAVQAQVLDQVPSDALVVVKVNRLSATSQKLAKFAQDLGLAAMAPPLADPLGSLKQQAKITQGLDENGDMAFVFVDPAQAGGQPDKAMLLLFPVSDYQAFLGNFQGAQTEGDVSQITFGAQNQPTFVSKWGSFAALSPTRDVVANKPGSGLKLTGVAAQRAGDQDIIMVANFNALRTKLQPMLAEGREKMLAEVDEGLAEQPQAQKFSPVIKSAVNQALNLVDAFLRDATAATVSLKFGDAGINASAMAEFAPSSYLGNLVSSLKNTDETLLEGLPSGKYLIFGGAVTSPDAMTKLFDDFAGPVLQELKAVEGVESQAVQQYGDAVRQILASNRGQTFGMIAPAGQIGAEPLLQYVSILKGDAKAISQAQQQLVKTQEQMMAAFGVPNAVSSNVTPAAKTVEGVTFDQLTTQVNPGGDPAAAQQQQQIMGLIYGPAGMSVLMGPVSDDALLVASGVSDETLSSVINNVKQKQSPLKDRPGLQAVADQLPKSRLVAVYIPVDEIVATGVHYAGQFNFPVPVQLPPDLPPIGATISTENTALIGEAHVPTQLVQRLVAAGMQAFMQMQGGGGGQGGGL